ncbi:hypothetical protein Angca_005886, partial [Angiostrongylus cantonensis]
MANVDAIPGYLAVSFPNLPSEIKDYISSILKENVDEILTLDDVIAAVGDHLQSYVKELCSDGLNRTCLQLLRFLHGEIHVFMNLPKVEEHGVTTKKLDQAVDMAAERHNFAEMESIWKLRTRDAPTSVDKKKLGKAENRAAQKAEQRGAEPVVRKKRPESTATASQAPIRDPGVRGANVKDVKLESIDISIGTKQLLSSADLTMAYGRRYGLVGRNGIGKTTLLKMISSEQLRIPSGISLLAVEQEVEGDDVRVIDAVLASDKRRQAMIEEEKVLQTRLNKENLTEAEKSKWNEELSKLYAAMENLQLDK